MASDDTQREMEQRALRNVRGLVEKIETTEELEARKQRKVLLWILGGALLLAILVAIGIATSSRSKGKEVVIEPAKLPPLKGGPQQ
jgi:hypothetical protein